jgi:hypothetical protein
LINYKGDTDLVVLLRIMGQDEAKREDRVFKCLSVYDIRNPDSRLELEYNEKKEEVIERSSRIYNFNYRVFDSCSDNVLEYIPDSALDGFKTNFNKIEV